MAKNRFVVDFLFGAKKQGSFDKTFSSISKSVKSLTKTVAGVAATYVSAKALADVGKSALESASGLEGYRSTLNVVLKDQQKAAKMMAWAVEFANKTPFETDSVVEATVRLQSYGIEAQKVMTQIGDMAGVMNKDLMQAVEAVADAQTGELERLKEFGITKAMITAKGAELYKNQTIVNNKGQIVDQQKFNDALFALMEERFKGGMEIQAKSYKGLMSTISGVWKTGLAQMAGISGTGEIIEGSAFDAAKEGLGWVSDKMQSLSKSGTFEKIGKKIGSTVQTGIKYGKKVLDVAKRIKDSVGDTIRTISAKLEPLRPTFESIQNKAVNLGRKLTDGFTRAGPPIKAFAERYIPKAVEAVAKLADKAMSFANFIIDHWNVIGPIVKGVVASFLTFKGLNALSNTIGKVKQLTEVFQGVKGVTGIVGKIQKLSGTFKGLGGIAKLVASPFAKWALIIGAVVAGIILIYKNADKIKAAFSKLGDWIIAKVQPAVDWLNGAADWVGEKWGQAVDFFKNLGPKIEESLKTMGENVKTFFSGIWEGLVDGFKGFINFFIKGINTLIGGANKLSFTAPDWVPGIGGKTIGFNLPTIPLLAKGGIATGPTLAMVGEGREHEAILPLSKLQSLIQRAKGTGGGGGGGNVYHYNPHIEVNGGSPEDVERIMAEDKKRFEKWRKEQEEYERRTRIKPKPKPKLA
mgnify:FL=1